MSDLINKISEEFKVIGRHRYNHLKKQLSKLDQENVEELVKFRELEKMSVAEAEKQIEKFEAKHNYKKKSSEKSKEYFESLKNKKETKKSTLSYDDFKQMLYDKFMQEYFKKNGVKYNIEGVYYENLKPIFYYFLGDYKNFLKCENLLQKKNCVPSLNKGLLLIGDYGNGKTSTMEAFSQVTKFTKKHFEIIGAKEAVTKYSFLKNDAVEQKNFYEKLVNRKYLFDDILKEDKASSYGKLNLIEQVLEEKYRKNIITHATLNYKEDSTGIIENVEVALKQIGEKYGGYLYDRAFSMFNIIEFKGKSFRK